MTAPAEPLTQNPLVATLAMSPSAQQFFDELRRLHFPPERNFLNAHLTLFHALPDEPHIVEDLRNVIKDREPFNVTAQAIVSLGNGTAFKIIAPELTVLHQRLQKNWHDFLSNQDRQKRNFHITVQNKVESNEAKRLQTELAKVFQPFNFTVSGIQLWRYLQGPWEYKMTLDFGTDR